MTLLDYRTMLQDKKTAITQLNIPQLQREEPRSTSRHLCTMSWKT